MDTVPTKTRNPLRYDRIEGRRKRGTVTPKTFCLGQIRTISVAQSVRHTLFGSKHGFDSKLRTVEHFLAPPSRAWVEGFRCEVENLMNEADPLTGMTIIGGAAGSGDTPQHVFIARANVYMSRYGEYEQAPQPIPF